MSNSTPPRAGRSTLPLGRSIILIADDDPRIVSLLRRELENEGYEVVAASEGPEVFEILEDLTPDLFLLDVMMPDMDGFEVCRRLNESEKHMYIPVLFLTAMDKPGNVIKGFNCGASDYITKPIRKDELLARVGAHLRLHKAMLELERLRRLALDANPSTGLPGNNSIREAVSKAIDENQTVSVIYTDLDNFKAFNDKYGFARGDNAINFTARVIQKCVKDLCGPEAFVGHIGGDDFVLISPSQIAKEVADEIARRFDAGVLELYDAEDIEKGGIIAEDRAGNSREFRIMTISLSGVCLDKRRFSHYLEVAAACAEGKKIAKSMEGSAVFFDRRREREEKSKTK